MQLSGKTSDNNSKSSPQIQRLASLNGIAKASAFGNKNNPCKDVTSCSVHQPSTESENGTDSNHEPIPPPTNCTTTGEFSGCGNTVKTEPIDGVSSVSSSGEELENGSESARKMEISENGLLEARECKKEWDKSSDKSSEEFKGEIEDARGVANELEGKETGVKGEEEEEERKREELAERAVGLTEEERMEVSGDETEPGNEVEREGQTQGYEPGFGEFNEGVRE